MTSVTEFRLEPWVRGGKKNEKKPPHTSPTGYEESLWNTCSEKLILEVCFPSPCAPLRLGIPFNNLKSLRFWTRYPPLPATNKSNRSLESFWFRPDTSGLFYFPELTDEHLRVLSRSKRFVDRMGKNRWRYFQTNIPQRHACQALALWNPARKTRYVDSITLSPSALCLHRQIASERTLLYSRCP